MTDDIMTALRRMATTDFREAPRIYVSPQQAADEIERLRKDLTTAQTMWMLEEAQKNKWKSLCEGIVEAITNEGREPFVHRRIIAKHRSEWMTLWERIDKAIKAVSND